MRILSILISVLLFLPTLSLAQVTKERELVGSTGGSVQAGSLDVSYSVGESVIQTAISGTLVVTQGFQQSDQNPVGIDDLEDLKVSYRIFPNPTPDQLTIEVEKQELVEISLSLSDMTGKKLPGWGHKFVTAGSETVEWSLQDLPTAIYLLHFHAPNGRILETHKIQVLR